MTDIYTIGHSTRSIDDFLEILHDYNIVSVIDVRTIPKSRHNPQYNEEDLRKALKRAHIGYLHCAGLGGLRHTTRASVNTGWRNASFRGFADYMQTPEFDESMEELIRMAQEQTIVIMCAEALPWRCHRSLISDALLVRKLTAMHIFSKTNVHPHTLTPFARIKGKRITYPSPEAI